MRPSIFPYFLVMMLFSSSLLATGVADMPNQFTAKELSEIRQVSTALLHVRGQKRRAALLSSVEFKKDVAELKRLVSEIKYEFEKPVLELNTSEEVSARVSLDGKESLSKVERFGHQIRSWYNANFLEKTSPIQTTVSKSPRFNEHRQRLKQKLEKAEQLVASRAKVVEGGITPRWKVWVEKDAKKERLHNKLIEIQGLLVELNENPANRESMESLIDKLNPKSLTESLKVPQPTISSITKHRQQ